MAIERETSGLVGKSNSNSIYCIYCIISINEDGCSDSRKIHPSLFISIIWYNLYGIILVIYLLKETLRRAQYILKKSVLMVKICSTRREMRSYYAEKPRPCPENVKRELTVPNFHSDLNS